MAEPIAPFVARRKPEWDRLGALLSKQRASKLSLAEVNQLDRLYRRANADLARAQAHFPGTDVERFLNRLCGDAYGQIYRPRPDRLAALATFFGSELPSSVRANGGLIAISAALMLLGTICGALAILFDARAVDALIPDGVKAAVETHQMWTDSLVSVSPTATSSAIATNNLSVTITVFVSGIAFGAGTTILLFLNGLSLGAVSAYCLRHAMGRPLLAFIGAHGPLELSIIAIAGGAGLMLARAMIDPGESTRGQALTRSSREAVRLVLGCAPFLAAAGILEGFVDPGSTVPGLFKIILGWVIGIIFWFYLAVSGKARSERVRSS